MKSITSILSMIAASAALLVAQGTTHTWTNLNTGSTLYWNVDANWDATFPNAAGFDLMTHGSACQRQKGPSASPAVRR